jgi:hypothetical protein
MNIRTTFSSLLIVIMLPMSGLHAETSGAELAQLQGQLISPWLVTVDGESRQRAMTIKSITPKAEGVFALDMVYGLVGGGQGPLKGELVQQGERRKITFVTQANSKIAAEQSTTETFEGTFTNPKGGVQALKMTKISEEDLRLKAEEFLAALAERLAKPGPDVPESCARFFGGWAGTWGLNQGPQRLWVLGIKADCTAEYSYRSTSSNAVPETLLPTQIKQGVLNPQCGGGTGTCTFVVHGDEIWANYNGGYGQNNGVFQRIK